MPDASFTPGARQPADADSRKTARPGDSPVTSVYAARLRAPLTTIATNVAHRPGIASAAVLGYDQARTQRAPNAVPPGGGLPDRRLPESG
ncbi:hypothetical protein GQ56_0121195 [Burkholderia paludis]|uniref:hypothetical protein n=1 Tax=Burkholderia paludis TaxID=1506587 RepID=UPI0004DB557E|nr:hypothetical protein [Burkholderia paludis]KFG95291.1 hypothetical protein GQ56_0121195 [Burkholderia paludis]